MSCPVTGLTQKERKDAQDCWFNMIGDSEETLQSAATNLILWMLEAIPDIKPQFRKFSATQPSGALQQDDAFIDHSMDVIRLLRRVVDHLDDPDQLKDDVQWVAQIHTEDHHVDSSFFVVLASQFHSFLESILDIPEDHKWVIAWTKLLTALADTLIKHESEQST